MEKNIKNKLEAGSRNVSGGIPIMMNTIFINIIEEYKGNFSIKFEGGENLYV